jgi:hypothetical protein
MLPVYTDEQLSKLDCAALIDLVVRDEDRVPRNVIDACALRGNAIVEYLAGLIERDGFWKTDATPGEWWLPLHAAMILGLIPGEEAGRALAALMRRMAAGDDHDQQSWLDSWWPALFENKPDVVLGDVRELAMDHRIHWYIRAHALNPVVAAAERRGDEALDEALDWAAGIAADEDQDWDLRLNAGNLLLDFSRPRHRTLLEDLARRQGAFGVHFSAKDVRHAYASGGCEPEWHRSTDPWSFYAPRAIEERQRRWAEEGDGDDLSEHASYEKEPVAPHVRATAKIGRNDFCPCGSGKKYKKCCLPELQ